MPNRDGTGPRGEGSRTGRQEGNCVGATPIRRGLGRRRGQGIGRGRRYLD